MIGYTVFNKVKVTWKNENILYIGTSKFYKTSYFQEQSEYYKNKRNTKKKAKKN